VIVELFMWFVIVVFLYSVCDCRVVYVIFDCRVVYVVCDCRVVYVV